MLSFSPPSPSVYVRFLIMQPFKFVERFLVCYLVCGLNCIASAAYYYGSGSGSDFVRARGSCFEAGGRPFYFNGFNAYYLASLAVDSRPTVSLIMSEAAAAGLTVCRTWAFNDGAYHALQLAPGVYDESSFRALDFVIHEAQNKGIRVILSLVDNYASMGGKAQYVSWAKDAGASVTSEDDFFRDQIVKSYYKNYVKDVLLRVNTLSGVAYKDDPTIFAWELMNEPRCPSDLSGNTLNGWIEEMSAYIKSIDGNHMVEAGLEGSYGPSSSEERQHLNPTGLLGLGVDSERHARIPSIDFITAHLYPDQWLPGSSLEEQLACVTAWIEAHIEDGNTVGKPMLVAEFGSKSQESWRNSIFNAVYESINLSAEVGGAGAGALLWQLCTPDIQGNLASDGYGVSLSPSSSTSEIIAIQSHKMSLL
ncbi:hypothetical protein KP509_01G122900 [Ceratopteris richardii]|uniref:mannan endo-1,4-beta-mannosidase n=1 Tax=Ceratopteris richardii TaxID=49495 RepID=A0A8T2VKH6_CERRI|nr:hypothetical protein KP509_01G122900 [Ceratopteris richardii]